MKRILFVDDEPAILDAIKRMLRVARGRWDLQFAVGGEAALEACEAGSFDLVFSDMRMPRMDGATLLGHIRDRWPTTVRVILSGHSEAGSTIRSIPVAHRVLTKPLECVELQAAIEQICSLQDILCASELRQLMGTIGELPSLSATYLSLVRAVKDPLSSIRSIAGIIERDVAMSAKVLQLVNSGFFGLAQHVTNLERAIQYLGMETVKNLGLTTEAFKVFASQSPISQSACETMQNHAERTAIIASTLPIQKESRDTVIVAALLHDVGRLVIASKLPNQFNAILSSSSESGERLFEAEEQLLGISHAELGAYLLGLWGIDNLVVEAIAHHHHPNRIPHRGFDGSTAVYVADLLAHELDDHPQDNEGLQLNPADRLCLEELGLLSSFPELRDRALQTLN